MKVLVVFLCFVVVVVANTSTVKSNATTTTTKSSYPTTTTKKPNTTTTATTTTRRPPTTTTTTTTRRPPTTEPPVDCDISVSEDDLAILLPNPEECESYYVCDSGKAILMPCPKGLHFNPKLLVCDWPDEANCIVDSGSWGDWEN